MLGGEKVCIKVLRVYNAKTDDQKQALSVSDIHDPCVVSLALTLWKPFYGEAVVWKRLKHPNVVPFLGVSTTPLQLVSRWMPNGTLTEYVKAKPHANRISLVRIPPTVVHLSKLNLFKLLDVAEGLNYLHTCHTVHGDLKGVSLAFFESAGIRVLYLLFQAKHPSRWLRQRTRL